MYTVGINNNTDYGAKRIANGINSATSAYQTFQKIYEIAKILI